LAHPQGVNDCGTRFSQPVRLVCFQSAHPHWIIQNEATQVEFMFTENQVLEMLYEISQGRAVGLAIDYQDEEGNQYETVVPIEREQLEEMLRRQTRS
jgi:hypothetical protein